MYTKMYTTLFLLFSVKKIVDFRFRMLAFRGACCFSPLGPHDVGHVCVTTGRPGISIPTYLTTCVSLNCPAIPT